MISIGVLGSTNGTDLQAIFDAINNNIINGSVKVVISNRKKAFILKKAAANGVGTHFVSQKNKTREEFDREVSGLLKDYDIELILLIGFMRILSKEFCYEWQDKILNVHPSLLPKYAGGMDTNVHQEVLNNGETETGCTIHFVTEKVDGGPILIQKSCPVEYDDTVESLKKKVQTLEGHAFVEAINLITSRQYVRTQKNK